MNKEFLHAHNRYLLKLICRYGLGIGLGILLVVWMYEPTEEDALFYSLGILVLWFVLWLRGWCIFDRHRADRNFHKQYKKHMIDNALQGESLYDDISFQYDAGFSKNFMETIGMLSVRRFRSDCSISGKYKGIEFMQADICNWDNFKLGINNYIIVLDYSGTLYAVKTNWPSDPPIHIFHGDMSYITRAEQRYTGNVAFDREMKVYCEDREAVKKLLTEDFQQRLLKWNIELWRAFALTIQHGYLYVYIEDKKSPLKPKLFKKYTEEMKEDILKELSMAGRIIDGLIMDWQVEIDSYVGLN